MSIARHLVVFAKTPRLGRVKTRLGRDIGQVAAWNFYRHLMDRTCGRLRQPGRWHCWLAVSPDRDIWRDRLWPAGWNRISQGAGDLGQRMTRIMEVLPPGPTVIIGTDVPEITNRHIDGAFGALGSNDAVFGPAPDGGYWLVGLRRRPVFVDPFQGVRWSTSHALADTTRNLGGRSIAQLDELPDIDDGAAFAVWRAQQKAGSSRPPAFASDF